MKNVSYLYTTDEVREIAKEHQMQIILKDLKNYEILLEKEVRDNLWDHFCSAPHRITVLTGDFSLQILDEFQYLNQYVYADKNLKEQLKLAGSYHGLSESRIAPLFITGSMIGWLRDILLRQLNPRFDQIELEPFSSEEALEAVYTYGKHFNANLTEESALEIQRISHNYPYYISRIIRSKCPHKNLSMVKSPKQSFYSFLM